MIINDFLVYLIMISLFMLLTCIAMIKTAIKRAKQESHLTTSEEISNLVDIDDCYDAIDQIVYDLSCEDDFKDYIVYLEK